ncbi:MAG: hypothetical protein GY765_09280, partial [bacterium]|nr:hypothetical protein [bacterium]
DYPIAGTWTFRRKPGIVIQVEEELGTAQYYSPVSPLPIEALHKITFKLHGGRPSQPFTQLKGYPLEGKIIINTPANTRDILNALPDTGTPGHFVSNVSYKFDQQGVYKVQFSGSAVTGAGNKERVIESGLQEVTVKNIRPVKILLESPGSLSTLSGSISDDVKFVFHTNDRQTPIDEIVQAKPVIEAEFLFFKGPDK